MLGGKTCTSATLYTTNPTWNILCLNPRSPTVRGLIGFCDCYCEGNWGIMTYSVVEMWAELIKLLLPHSNIMKVFNTSPAAFAKYMTHSFSPIPVKSNVSDQDTV